ncbi:ankyrin repeat [Chlorella sorokiniana]|uniref:Ankyrin repeat n=1 Tax=Chlorella sorokiniana TaxID=3076 RepID=A0A2P6TUV4_CHLSO|nr:ankyrin repeat [Chlorella sorokiniana]|eukprot:PRW57847.1 ankyrin repeat [Chlorella sorokiniana]
MQADSYNGLSATSRTMNRYGRLDMLELLLTAGADPNARDKQGRTPLHHAACFNARPELTRALVLAGAQLDCLDDSGLTPLETFCSNPRSDFDAFAAAVMQAAKERALFLYDLHSTDLPKPLHRAAACGQPGVLRALLSQGSSPDVASRQKGATPLILAAQLGHETCVRELLAASADSSAADRAGNTAAYYAAQAGDWHCLRRLLSAGASADQACEGGRTALHVAAAGGHEACLVALLEAGADINAPCQAGLTACLLAALAGQEHCVWTLLMSGAAPTASFPGAAADEGTELLEAAEEAQALIQDAAERLGLLQPAAQAAAAGGGNAALAAMPAAPAAPAGAALDDALRGELCCPITHEVMTDPVIAADGTTYERQAIETWIAR